MRVAIFDFDGTLYKKETFQLLMDHLKNHPKYGHNYGHFFRTILPRFIAYKLKLYPEARMKERSMQIYINALKDVPKNDVTTYFSEIFAQMKDDFNEIVVDRLNYHRQKGDYIMLVSGAFTPLLEAVAVAFPIDHVIGTKIPYQNNTLDTSRPIRHIQNKRKTEEIFTALKNKSIDWEQSYAYGDSYADLPVLELVGNPVAVQPDDRLREKAKQEGWEII